MYALRFEGTDFSDDIVRLCQDFNHFVRSFPFEGVKREFFGLRATFRIQ